MIACPPVSVAARDMLDPRRKEIRELHSGGSPGSEVSGALVRLCDDAVLRIYTRAIEAASAADRGSILESLSLVAVGGYGRGDLAPYSDVDLLFLVDPRASACVREVVSRLVRDLWDAGLHLSQSVRSPAECAAFADSDFAAKTALFETRLLAGDPGLFADLRKRVGRLLASQSIARFIDEALVSRAMEHHDYYAQTVCLLEPNVKKSPGGLRDLHLFGWLALLRYGTTHADALGLKGVIGASDVELVRTAGDFLRRIRHELHFQADAAQDVLTREEQVRLAEWMGFRPEGSLLPVERFMQYYYRQTLAVHDVLMRLVDRVRGLPPLHLFLSRFTTHRIDRFILINRLQAAIDPSAPDGYLRQAEPLVQLFDLARGYGVRVAHDTVARVLAAIADCEITPAARARFRQCLGHTSGLGSFLRNLHRVGLLERLLPPLDHARGLIQFNLMHHYTIDEHCLRAVEAAVNRDGDRGPIGLAYREIRRKDVLHLALLLHDLGKGLGGDHCEIGARMAEETALAFALNDRDRHLLVFLVRQHLLMAHTAFRRDLSDDRTVIQFARAVATPEALRLLYVMTAADIEAVAPNEFTNWKESLLTDLYVRAMQELTGEAPATAGTDRVEGMRRDLCGMFEGLFERGWVEEQLEAMPRSYLLGTEPQRVEAHLRMLHGMADAGVRVMGEYLPDVGLSQYTVLTHDQLTPGIFSKIAGTLAASGFRIADAQIITRSDGAVLDVFRGLDQDFSGPPPDHRVSELAQRIEQVLLGSETVEALLARRGRPLNHRGGPLPCEPAKVEIDNESSDRFTIIDVFTEDRMGLLYAITKTLFDLELSVYSAKISTHYDQVVDAFCVTDREGGKVMDDRRLDEIRARLLTVV